MNVRFVAAGVAAAALAAGIVVWMSDGGGPAPAPKSAARDRALDWVDPAKGLKILMFYPSPGYVAKGEAAILCYGVANADEVALDPPEAKLTPVLNRCVEVKPERTTTYTLTASNKRGETQSQQIEVVVGKAAAAAPVAVAPEAKTPRIDYFRKEGSERDEDITVHKLCFRVWNAEQVQVDPEAFPASRVFQGCFAVAPRKQTTYTLTARGKDGAAVTASLTVGP